MTTTPDPRTVHVHRADATRDEPVEPVTIAIDLTQPAHVYTASIDEVVSRVCANYDAKVAAKVKELAEVGLSLQLVDIGTGGSPASQDPDLTMVTIRGTYRIVPLKEEAR